MELYIFRNTIWGESYICCHTCDDASKEKGGVVSLTMRLAGVFHWPPSIYIPRVQKGNMVKRTPAANIDDKVSHEDEHDRPSLIDSPFLEDRTDNNGGTDSDTNDDDD